MDILSPLAIAHPFEMSPVTAVITDFVPPQHRIDTNSTQAIERDGTEAIERA